jgi:antibiotic biosynthesis monooxygenase (ABM) superfamily enzyme
MPRYEVVMEDLDMSFVFDSREELEEWLDSPEAATWDFEVIEED